MKEAENKLRMKEYKKEAYELEIQRRNNPMKVVRNRLREK